MTLRFLKFTAFAAFCCPLICTAVTSVLEIRYRYGPQELVDFIRDNHLEDRKILCAWEYLYEEDEQDSDEGIGTANIIFDETLPIDDDYPAVKKHMTCFMGDCATVPAFFDRDAVLFPYFNVCESQQKWMLWKEQSDEEIEQTFDKWAEIGLPDFIIGTCLIQEAFPEDMLDGVTYYWIGDMHYGKIWKLDYYEGNDHIFIRGDLLDEYPQFQVKTYAEEAKKP